MNIKKIRILYMNMLKMDFLYEYDKYKFSIRYDKYKFSIWTW